MTDFRLHTFLAVCREKSFTRAAETLGLTQPAVSQHIQYLEDDLGQKLLSVQGRSITITAAGEYLLRFAERTEAEAGRTRELIADARNRRAFRCGATRTIGEFVMPDCLAGWYRDHPDVEVSMIVDNSERLFALLREGALDFLFVEGPFVKDDYSTDLLLRDRLALVCAPDHPFAGQPVAFDDLLGETLIVREEGSGSRQLVEGLLAARNLSLGSFHRVLEIGNVGAIKRLVAGGAGIAFLYGASVPEIGTTGTLARIPARGASLSHEYTFACGKDSLYEAEYRVFFDYCRRRVLA
jgi:LysR family transcriptional regulator, transcriptional activator of the cysJI operon